MIAHAVPTEAEMRKAYARAGLLHVGFTFERALETPHLRLALTECVFSSRDKAAKASVQTAEACKPTQTTPPKAAGKGCYLSMQFQLQED